MRKIAETNILIIVIFLFSLASFGQDKKTQTPTTNNESPITVDFCDVINKPMNYSGKLIRVRGLYENSFEKSSFYSPKCYLYKYPQTTWVKYDSSYQQCTEKKILKRFDKLTRKATVDVVFVGKFETEGQFGHLDMYLTGLTVTCIENVQELGHFKSLPEEKK